MEKRFLTKNNRGDRVRSANKPIVNVTVDKVRPMTVKY